MRHFGTDGIRGKAEIFTKEYLKKVARATLSALPNAKVVIGRDTRESGQFIENQLADALLEYGGRVVVIGMVATPVLAYITQQLKGDFGIMISASHNQPEYNGIKFFSDKAEKLRDEQEKKIDFFIDNPQEIPPQEKIHSKEFYYGDEDYINFLIDSLKPNIKGMKVCLDCANGSASNIAPMLFAKLGAKVTALKTGTTGKDINDGCGATSIEYLETKMLEGDYDIGFSYDGDGDRIKAMQKGKLFDGDHLMYVHGRIMMKEGKLNNNTIVGTIMSNMGTQIACESKGITLLRTGVGDKFVQRKMMECGHNVGGEESGHIIFGDYMKTGDGILASLLTAMLAKNHSLIELDDIVEYPKVIDCYKCNKETVERYYADEEIQKYLNQLKFDGRFVVRPSGTEPIIRILVEALDQKLAEQKAAEIKGFLVRRLES